LVLPSVFWQGVDEFNRREFYACHDTLESLWLESREPDKTFYQGILQISVGCYHLEQNNWKGAVTLLGEGINKLKDYTPTYEGVAVSDLFIASHLLLKQIQSIKPEKLSEASGNLRAFLPTIVKIDTDISGE
jgi:uncharacterized protein